MVWGLVNFLYLIMQKFFSFLKWIFNQQFYIYSMFFLIWAILLADRDDYFPNSEDELIYGEYRVGYIGAGNNGGGLLINLYDRYGGKLIYDPKNARLSTKAYWMMDSIMGSDQYIKVGWYPTCLFGKMSISWPCPAEVVIEKDGEVYLSFTESKATFDRRSDFSKFLWTYYELFLSFVFFCIGLISYLIKRK